MGTDIFSSGEAEYLTFATTVYKSSTLVCVGVQCLKLLLVDLPAQASEESYAASYTAREFRGAGGSAALFFILTSERFDKIIYMICNIRHITPETVVCH